MTKKERALEVIRRLKKEYPDAHCTLAYQEPWQLLVSVRLSAQCTDKRVDMITPKLYEKFPSIEALANADVSEIEEIVRPCGLGPSKARDISKCMKMLHYEYHDQVPDTMEELLKLPGVGRKSANLILGDVFGKPAIVTDTHCIRLSNLIGLVDNVKEPAKVEKELRKIIPPEEGSDLCHRFVQHGREVCVARHPKCEICCLRDVCKHGSALYKTEKKSRE
ncbi:MAG: endonuclease III [Eubacteriales bacterium]|jgi:endonuclease-3